MKKAIFITLILTFLSSSCFSFDGVTANLNAMEQMPTQHYEISTVSGTEMMQYEGGRLIVLPRAGNSDLDNNLNILMRSCDECQEVPIIGVKPGGGRKPLPITNPRELCQKYPFLKGCSDSEN